MGTKDLISVLAEMGQLTAEQSAKARVELVSSDKKQLEIVRGLGVADEEALSKAQATVLALPYFDQPSLVLSPELLNLVPNTLAETYKVIPLAVDKTDNSLAVIMGNPEDLTAIDFLEKRTGMRVKVWLTSPSRLRTLIDQNYAQSLIGEVSEVLKKGEAEEETVE